MLENSHRAVRAFLPEMHHVDLQAMPERLIRGSGRVTVGTLALLEPDLPLVGKVGMAPAPGTNADPSKMDRLKDGLSFPTASAWQGAARSCVGHGCVQPVRSLGPRKGPPGPLSSLRQAGHRAFLSGLTPGHGIAAGKSERAGHAGLERCFPAGSRSKMVLWMLARASWALGFSSFAWEGTSHSPSLRDCPPIQAQKMGGLFGSSPSPGSSCSQGGMRSSLQHQLPAACVPRQSGPALELPSRCSMDMSTLLGCPPTAALDLSRGLESHAEMWRHCCVLPRRSRGFRGLHPHCSPWLLLSPLLGRHDLRVWVFILQREAVCCNNEGSYGVSRSSVSCAQTEIARAEANLMRLFRATLGAEKRLMFAALLPTLLSEGAWMFLRTGDSCFEALRCSLKLLGRICGKEIGTGWPWLDIKGQCLCVCPFPWQLEHPLLLERLGHLRLHRGPSKLLCSTRQQHRFGIQLSASSLGVVPPFCYPGYKCTVARHWRDLSF